jgi:hypothetical protein
VTCVVGRVTRGPDLSTPTLDTRPSLPFADDER